MIRSRRRIVLAIIPLLPGSRPRSPRRPRRSRPSTASASSTTSRAACGARAPRFRSSPSARSATSTPRTSTSPSTIRPTSRWTRPGNIYVLDTGNARIQKFGPDGAYLATIGRKGQGPGEFIMPDALDIDRDGNLVVADPAQCRIHDHHRRRQRRPDRRSQRRTDLRRPLPRRRAVLQAAPRPTPFPSATSPAGRPARCACSGRWRRTAGSPAHSAS